MAGMSQPGRGQAKTCTPSSPLLSLRNQCELLFALMTHQVPPVLTQLAWGHSVSKFPE